VSIRNVHTTIDFADAIRIFDGPVVESPDEREVQEIRWIGFRVHAGSSAPERQRAMKPNRTIKQSSELAVERSDWHRVDRQTDEQIHRAIQSDPDAAPEVDAAWFKTARVVMPEPKQAVSLRLDRDVVKWFKKQGPGYQTRINAVLRTYVNSRRG